MRYIRCDNCNAELTQSDYYRSAWIEQERQDIGVSKAIHFCTQECLKTYYIEGTFGRVNTPESSVQTMSIDDLKNLFGDKE